MGSKKLSRRTLWILLCILAVLLCTHLLLQHLNLNVYNEKQAQVFEFSNRFDFVDESSIPTWFAQFLYAAIGVTALWISRIEKTKSKSRLWFLIGLLGLIFSLDEVASLHETILQNLHVLFFGDATPSASSNAWLLILPFILLGGIYGLRLIMNLLPKQTFVLFLSASIIFILGAICIDILIVSLDKTSFLAQGIVVGIEETFEMLASIIALYAMFDYIETKHRDQLTRLLAK